jgi:hypothetical protein
MSKLTKDELAFLRMFTPSTYGINLPRDVAKSLEKKGLVEWVPYTSWSGTIYGITDAGRDAIIQAETKSCPA